MRLILDGTVVRVRLDRRPPISRCWFVMLGVPRDGQKVLLAVKNTGGESEAAWRSIPNGMVGRGLRTPEFLVTDGGAGLDRALAALWPEAPAQRWTVHKTANMTDNLPKSVQPAGKSDLLEIWAAPDRAPAETVTSINGVETSSAC